MTLIIFAKKPKFSCRAVNGRAVLVVASFVLVVNQSLCIERCPFEEKTGSIQGYGYGVPRTCVSLISATTVISLTKSPYDAVSERCSQMKDGRIGLIDKNFKSGPYWKFVKGRFQAMKVLNGWKLTKVVWYKDLAPCADDAIGCSYINITLNIAGDLNRVHSVRLHHSTMHLTADVDLNIGYLDLLRIITTGIDDPYCSYVPRDESTHQFGDPRLFNCDEWDFAYFLCVSSSYRDCTFELTMQCHYDSKMKQCFVRNQYAMLMPAEAPYGMCPKTHTDYEQPCLCPSCSMTVWSAWTKFNSTCGPVIAERFRPRNGESPTSCDSKTDRSARCCREVRYSDLGPCETSKAPTNTKIIIWAIMAFAVVIIMLLLVCLRALYVRQVGVPRPELKLPPKRAAVTVPKARSVRGEEKEEQIKAALEKVKQRRLKRLAEELEAPIVGWVPAKPPPLKPGMPAVTMEGTVEMGTTPYVDKEVKTHVRIINDEVKEASAIPVEPKLHPKPEHKPTS